MESPATRSGETPSSWNSTVSGLGCVIQNVSGVMNTRLTGPPVRISTRQVSTPSPRITQGIVSHVRQPAGSGGADAVGVAGAIVAARVSAERKRSRMAGLHRDGGEGAGDAARSYSAPRVGQSLSSCLLARGGAR